MIRLGLRLGLRLAFAGGREALGRLVLIAAAVSLGVGLLLGVLAALNATTTQNDRNLWLGSGTGVAAADVSPGAAPLWWLLRADAFAGEPVGRLDVAATGPGSPVPPGLPRLPGPGEYYASPALAELIRTVPADELAARYPGRLAGTIGDAALAGPETLLAVVGRTPQEMSGMPEAVRVEAIASAESGTCAGPNCRLGINAAGTRLILSVAAAGLVFPVVVLIGTATRLSAARRERRFAAMRLVGATPRQISLLAAVESAVAGALGVALGFAVFLPLRPFLGKVDFTGTHFFGADLTLTPAQCAVVAVGVPLVAAAATLAALRRVRVSPLGVARRATPRPPHALRVVPLVAGLAELGYFVGRRPETTDGQIAAFLSGALLVLAGIVVAGPWLTMAGARLLARRSRRPAALIAARRLADDPRAGFRAISGLVLALCVSTGAVGVITAMVDERSAPEGPAAVGNTLIADFAGGPEGPENSAAAPREPLLAALRAVPGVAGVTVLRENPLGTPDPTENPATGRDPLTAALASCAELATTPVFSVCEPGARTASVAPDFALYGLGFDSVVWPDAWPRADLPAAALAALPAKQIVVSTDGSRSAIEQARTLLTTAYPSEWPPVTLAERRAMNEADLTGYRRLAQAVVLVSFLVAGCGMAVGVAGGLSERKRPFGLLRLAGVPTAVLRRVVLLESAVPLLIAAAAAIGTGLLAAHLFLRAQLDYGLHAPGPEYWLLVVCGLAAGLAAIGAALPLLGRLTGPEAARGD
ncbi:ABC transporter permease [Actinocorallia aurea]